MNRYKKEFIFSSVILLIFGLLIYLETQLPVFKRFIPIDENKLIVVILNVNLLLILLLLFLATRTIVKVYLEKKRGIWGSGLKTKLTVTLLFISIIPSFTLFILSTAFFHVSMDKWFSQKIEDTMDNALEFAQFYYQDMFQRYEKTGSSLAATIQDRRLLGNEEALRSYLKKSKALYHLGYLSVFSSSGYLVKDGDGSNDEAAAEIAEKVPLARTHPIRNITALKNGELILSGTRIVDEDGEARAILLLGDVIKIHNAARVKEIATATKEFKESRAFKKILKYSFIIPLFLITILTVFFSIWVGMKMATEITVPIEKVKEGAAIIAKGKFDVSLEDRGTDEIGTLVGAFNSMAKELKIAKDEVEEKRRYMEVILDNVATGIISTDKIGTILLINRAARNILGIGEKPCIGTPLREIFGEEFKNITRPFLREMRNMGSGSVTKEMRLSLKKDVTYIRASLTTLKDESNKPEGFIITFDDITHIVRAEKLATWREVARKLTHEIKNPLTPIILSAERIRRRLLPVTEEGKEKQVLDETTSVIIRSVEDIKKIVNELTKLTHTSQAKTVEDINSVIEETMALYNNLYQNIDVRLDMTDVPQFRVDKDGLKRAMINLITNSIKAINGDEGSIVISTRYNRSEEVGVIEVADSGCGIPDEDKDRVFDPYFTKDKDGTGLGLAIVHSIILEHHGKIHVEDNLPKGTRFVIELPIIQS